MVMDVVAGLGKMVKSVWEGRIGMYEGNSKVSYEPQEIPFLYV